MGFITWIVNRRKEQPTNASPEQRPENAQQKYAREDAGAARNRKAVETMPPEQLAKARSIGEKVAQSIPPLPETDPPKTPSGGAAAPPPERQNMAGQERHAPALSPTGAHKGKPYTEKDPRPEPKTDERPKTLPRPTPSWQR